MIYRKVLNWSLAWSHFHKTFFYFSVFISPPVPLLSISLQGEVEIQNQTLSNTFSIEHLCLPSTTLLDIRPVKLSPPQSSAPSIRLNNNVVSLRFLPFILLSAQEAN